MLIDKIFNSMRVSLPGIIREFDPLTQTATVEIAIREHVRQANLEYVWTNIPPLLDVPVVFPRGGGYVLTFPIQPGDECLVVFADMCIDAWFSNGGVQNQIEKRRHDLSDGIAIPGLWSQPRVIQNFSMSSVQLRNESGSQYIEITEDQINLVGNVKANGKTVLTATT